MQLGGIVVRSQWALLYETVALINEESAQFNPLPWFSEVGWVGEVLTNKFHKRMIQPAYEYGFWLLFSCDQLQMIQSYKLLEPVILFSRIIF